MSKIKMVKGVVPCTLSNEDTRIVVDDAFSVLVPKGMIFSTDQDEIGEDKLLTMFSPVPDFVDLDVDSFDMQYGNSQTRVRINAEVRELDGTLDLTDCEIRKKVEEVLKNSMQRSTGLLAGLTGDGSSEPPFVVRSDEKIVVVATAQGFMGNASFILALPFGFYTGTYRVAKGADLEQVMEAATPEVYKKTAMTLLGTIEALEDNSTVVSGDGESASLLVSELSYTQNKYVTVGAISVPIPDGTECALCAATDGVDAVIPRSLRSNMDFICIPKAYSRGFSAYQDAPISIFFRKPTHINQLEHIWDSDSVDDMASQLTELFENSLKKQEMTMPLEIVHKEKGFMSFYSLYSGDNAQGAFWRSYVFFIAMGGIAIDGMFYFNQTASDDEFNMVVRNWLSEVRIADAEAEKEITATLAKEQLGPYAAENGKLDAILIAKLFAEDVLFFPETPFERQGNNLNLNLQFNATKREEHPFIVQNMQPFFSSLNDLFVQLDKNEKLLVPKNRIHPKMLRPLLDDRLTGLSFLNLMAYHMVKIVERNDEKNTYFVLIDQNVIAGIPDAYRYICQFIIFARKYNERSGAFAVQFSSVINFDSPISGKLTPVTGAAVGQMANGMCGFTVQEDGTITDGTTMTVDTDQGAVDITLGTRQPTAEEKMTDAELEAQLDADVINGLKQYAKEALMAYKKIPDELDVQSFCDLQSTEEVISRIMDMLSVGAINLCLTSTLWFIYRENIVRFESEGFDGLSYDLFVQYEDGEVGDEGFDPTRLPNDLITTIKQLTENEIYHALLVKAVTAQNSGKVLVAPGSPKTVIRKLEEYDEIEVSGSQYEGRNDRIECVKVGDKLKLVREPNNAYNKNAIDVQNESGSLGYLPSYIVDELSPLMDSGLVTCFATVSEVIPLSKRSRRAKKAILKVRLSYSQQNEQKDQPQKQHSKVVGHSNALSGQIDGRAEEAENAYNEKSINDTGAKRKELHTRLKAIEERKKARTAREQADKKARETASDIRRKMKNIQNTYESSANSHRRMMQMHTFDGPWDPELRRYFSELDDVIQELGSNTEKLIIKAIDFCNEISDSVTPRVAIGIIEEIEDAIEYVEGASICIENLDMTFKYKWDHDIKERSRKLKRVKADLNKKQAILDEEGIKQEVEDIRFEEAYKYGIDEKDLDKHRTYLAAKGKYQKAKCSKDFDIASKEFASISGYLDANLIKRECDEKSEKLRPIEKAKEELDDALEEYDDVSGKLKQYEDEYRVALLLRDEAVAAFGEKEKTHEYDKGDIAESKDRVIIDLESSVSDAEQRVLSAKKELEDSKVILSNTFFLSFGKKKELRNRISSIEETIASLENSLAELHVKLGEAREDKTIALRKLEEELGVLKENADKAKAKVSEVEERIVKTKVDCEEAKAVLEAKKKAYNNMK